MSFYIGQCEAAGFASIYRKQKQQATCFSLKAKTVLLDCSVHKLQLSTRNAVLLGRDISANHFRIEIPVCASYNLIAGFRELGDV